MCGCVYFVRMKYNDIALTVRSQLNVHVYVCVDARCLHVRKVHA